MGVIMPRYATEQQIADQINVAVRHCRIGKVTEKTKADYARALGPNLLARAVNAQVHKELASLRVAAENPSGKWRLTTRQT